MEEKPMEEKPMEEKPTREKPTREKPTREKPTREKPTGEEPTGEKPTGEEPTREKPTGEEPTGEVKMKKPPPLGAMGDNVLRNVTIQKVRKVFRKVLVSCPFYDNSRPIPHIPKERFRERLFDAVMIVAPGIAQLAAQRMTEDGLTEEEVAALPEIRQRFLIETVRIAFRAELARGLNPSDAHWQEKLREMVQIVGQYGVKLSPDTYHRFLVDVDAKSKEMAETGKYDLDRNAKITVRDSYVHCAAASRHRDYPGLAKMVIQAYAYLDEAFRSLDNDECIELESKISNHIVLARAEPGMPPKILENFKKRLEEYANRLMGARESIIVHRDDDADIGEIDEAVTAFLKGKGKDFLSNFPEDKV